MSKVDERIVEMKFENQGFEKNVDSSISALERLKSALNFNGAEKSIANVEKSVNGVDFSKITSSLDALTSRFSAWGVAGMTVIQDVTRAAERMGLTIYNATVGQIKRGGWTRATNIDQAKFMLEGLKVEWDDIKDDIDYGVADTAYGMDAAAKAASQLVASGVQLGDEMKGSLRAISGVAAMTNSSYEEISPIFTTIAGQGKVMTMQLRQLETRGLNVAATLGEQMGHTEEEIRDMVTKGKISFKEFAEAMDAAYGTHAKEANKTFEGAMANMKSALSRIGQNFAGPIRSNMVGVFNTLREIINTINKSKLGQVYKDFEDFAAKASNFVQNVLKKIDLSIIDDLVDKIHYAYLWFDAIMTELSPYWKGVEEGEKAAEKAVDDHTEALKDYEKVAEKVRNGEYGNGQERYDRLEKEGYNWKIVQNMVNEAEGSTKRYEVSEEELAAAKADTNNEVEKSIALESKGRRISREAYTEWMKQQQRKAGVESDGRKTSRAAYEEYAEQQRRAAKNEERIRNIKNTIADLKERLTPVVDGLLSVFDIVTNIVLAVVTGAIDPVLRIFTSLSNIIMDVLGFLGLGVSSIEDTMEATDQYGTLQGKVNAVLSTFATILETIETVIHELTGGNNFNSVLKLLLGGDKDIEEAETVGDTVSTVVEKIRELFSTLSNYLFGDGTTSLQDLLSTAADLFPVLVRAIPLVLIGLGALKVFRSLRGVAGIFNTLKEAPRYLASMRRQNNATALLNVAKAVSTLAAAFYGLSQLEWYKVARGSTAVLVLTAALAGLWIILNKFGRNPNEDTMASIVGVDGYLNSLANEKNAAAIFKISAAFAILSAALFALAQLSWEDLGKAGLALVAITGAIAFLMNIFKSSGGTGAAVTNPFAKFLTNLSISFNAFLRKLGNTALLGAVALTVIAIGDIIVKLSQLPIVDAGKAVFLFTILLGELYIMMEGISRVANNTDGDAVGLAILMGAVALVAKSLSKSITTLSKIDFDKGVKALTLMAYLLGELFVTTAGLSEVSKHTEGNIVGVVILMGAMAIVARSLSKTLKALSEIDFDAGVQGLGFMAVLLLELSATMLMLSSISKLAKDGSIGLAILMGTMALVAKSMSGLIVKLSEVTWDDGVKALVLMGLMLGELWAVMWGLSELSSNSELKGGKMPMAALMGALSLVARSMGDTLKELSTIGWDEGVRALTLMGFMLAELFLVVTGLSKVTKSSTGGSIIKSMGFLIGFGIATKLMASSVSELAALDGDGIAKAMAAVTYITVLIGTLLAVSSTISNSSLGVKSVLPITILLAALTGSLYLITKMDQANLSKSVKALTKIVLSLSVALYAMSKMNGGDIKIGPVLSMVGIIAAIVGAMYILTQLDTGAVANAGTALTKVFASVAAMLAATSLITKYSAGDIDVGGVLGSIGGVAILVAEVAGTLALLTLLPGEQINKLEPISESLKSVLGGVALVVAALALFSALGGGGENGAEESALIDVGNAGTAENIAKSSGIGKIIAVITGIILGLGAFDAILEDLTGGKIDVLGTIARILEEWEEPFRSLGSTVGNLIGGLAGGIVEGLTGASVSEIAQGFINELKNFPATLDSWINGLSTVANTLKEKADNGDFEGINLDSVKEFMNSMFEVADDIYEISKRFYLMKHSFDVAYGPAADMISTGADITIGTEDLGYLFTSWASVLTDFSTSLLSEGFDSTAANSAITTASDILGSFSGLIGNVKELGGGDSFSAITSTIETLPRFASALVQYSWAMVFLNSGAIEATTHAVSLVNALAGKGAENGVTNMSVDNGLLGWANKNQTALQQYANDLKPFADGLILYAKTIKDMEGYESAVTGTQVAIRIINALAGTGIELGLKMYINNGSGVFKHVELLNNYSSQLMGFAQGLVAYSWVIAFMNANAVTRTKEAVEIVNDLASAAPNTDYSKGFFGFISGNKLEDMGDNLGTFARGLRQFSIDIEGFEEENVVGVSDSIRGIVEAVALIEAEFATSTELGSLQGGLSSLSNKIIEINSYFAEGKMAIALAELKDNLKEFGRETGESIVGGILEGLSEGGEGDTQSSKVSSTLVQNLFGNATSFTSDLDTVKSRGLALVNAFIGGASEAISGDGFTAFRDALTETLTSTFIITEENGGQFRVAGMSLMANLAAGISGGAWSLRTAASVVVATAIATIRNKYTNFKQAGIYLMEGLAAGIRSGSSKVITAIQEEAEKHIAAAKEAYDQASPSKIFAQIGEYNMEGLANGFRDGLPSVIQAVNATSSDIRNVYEDELAKVGNTLAAAYMYINQVVQESMNTNPVITPVLDMSMLQNGIGSANGLLSSTFGFGNPLNYAQSMFPGSYMYGSTATQDMTRAQIVGAINGMRSDIKTLGEEMSNMQMVLDNGTLVGQLTPGTDKALGDIQKYKERWA